MIHIIISVMIAITCVVYYFCTRTFNYWRDKNVAGPKPIPFFGNLRDSVLRRKHIGISYKEIYDEFPNEDIIGIYRMTTPSIIVRDLDIIKAVLIKDFDVFPERGIEFSKKGLGDNLFHCDSNTWRALRNRLTPMFTTGKLKVAFHLLEENAEQLVSYLENVTCRHHEHETHHLFEKYTIASIMAVSFGIKVDPFRDVCGDIEKAALYTFRSTFAAELDMLIPNIWRKINVSLYPEVVKNFCYAVVNTAIKQKNGVLTGRINDLFDALLTMINERKNEDVQNKKEGLIEITDHLMAGQVFIFFAAGFGNNALSLSYALFRLAKHQDVQAKLIEEIDEVLAKYEGKLSYDALKEMTYLDKIFLETLRMNPLTNSIQRSAKVNYKVPGSKVEIERGTTVIISPYAIQRNNKLYPDPDKFEPERFSPEHSANRHPCAYIPFGTGPRSCLGRQLAKIQFATAIVKVFSKFRVEPSEKTKTIEDYDPMSTLLTTKGGIYVKIIPRKIKDAYDC